MDGLPSRSQQQQQQQATTTTAAGAAGAATPATPIASKMSGLRRNCNYCVLKKVRCVGDVGAGCSLCLRKGEICIYALKQKPGPKGRKRAQEGEEGEALCVATPPSSMAHGKCDQIVAVAGRGDGSGGGGSAGRAAPSALKAASKNCSTDKRRRPMKRQKSDKKPAAIANGDSGNTGGGSPLTPPQTLGKVPPPKSLAAAESHATAPSSNGGSLLGPRRSSGGEQSFGGAGGGCPLPAGGGDDDKPFAGGWPDDMGSMKSMTKLLNQAMEPLSDEALADLAAERPSRTMGGAISGRSLEADLGRAKGRLQQQQQEELQQQKQQQELQQQKQQEELQQQKRQQQELQWSASLQKQQQEQFKQLKQQLKRLQPRASSSAEAAEPPSPPFADPPQRFQASRLPHLGSGIDFRPLDIGRLSGTGAVVDINGGGSSSAGVTAEAGVQADAGVKAEGEGGSLGGGGVVWGFRVGSVVGGDLECVGPIALPYGSNSHLHSHSYGRGDWMPPPNADVHGDLASLTGGSDEMPPPPAGTGGIAAVGHGQIF